MNLPDFNTMQLDAIDFALDRPSCAWFMPPGMGKTRGYLEVINETGDKTLVIAPKLICSDTWPREIKKWGYQLSHRFLHGTRKTLTGRLPDISLINPEAIPWLAEQLSERRRLPWKFVIYDELSKMKNIESKRGEAWAPFVPRFSYRLGGTGTPVGAHLKDLFGEMYCCDYGKSLGTDYSRFLRRYFDENEYTRKLEPYSDSEAEILKKIRPRAISFDINDLDLPPLAHFPTWLDMPNDVRQFYTRMHDESMVEELELSAVNAAVRAGKLRQLASGGVIDDKKERKYLHDAKAARLREIVDEMQGQPIMVFFEFHSDYISICKMMGYEVPALYGKTPHKEAQSTITRWNKGLLPMVALHPRSAGYGLNLQDSGHVIVWYTVPWSYELLHQGIARLWRQGQNNRVLVYYLLIEDTVDEIVYERSRERAGLHDRVMEKLL